MKKFILFLFLIPLISIAQSDSSKYNFFDKQSFKNIFNSIEIINPHKLSVGLKTGVVYDVDFSELDIDQWSTDLKGNSAKSIPFSFLLNLDYHVSSSLYLGFNFGGGNIYGENDVMYHNGDFFQYNFTSQLNILSIKDVLTFYSNAGIGIISSRSSRSFIYDDVVFLENETESIKTDLGFGFSYNLNDRLTLNLERSYNRVADDGFDGWDDGTGNDKFITTLLGVNYKLASSKGSVESLIEELENFNNECFDCDELEKRISTLENKSPNFLDSISFPDNLNYNDLIARLNKVENQLETFEDQVKENIDISLSRELIEDLNERLFYPSDIDTINVTAYPRLDTLISFLKRYPKWEVLIVGYTDTDNTIEYNIDLSKRRASKVRDYLILKGVQNKISIQFKGETSPFVPNTTDENKQLNRRSEIILIRDIY